MQRWGRGTISARAAGPTRAGEGTGACICLEVTVAE